ncbi:hypothetical protein BH09MYX1_BH09MYX1_28150 [soil metagenome]
MVSSAILSVPMRMSPCAANRLSRCRDAMARQASYRYPVMMVHRLLSDVSSVIATWSTCAAMLGGSVWCWGNNGDYQ